MWGYKEIQEPNNKNTLINENNNSTITKSASSNIYYI